MSYTGASQLKSTELIVLNCVPNGEKDTASQLAAVIDRKGLFRLGHELAVAQCRTRQELVETLRAVLSRTVQGAMPMLHFDGHSSAEAMATATGETVKWDEIYLWLRRINVECRNNLFVSMGACEALRSFGRATITLPSPVNALLAAWDPVLAAVVEVGLETFYDSLFETRGDMDSALRSMRAAVSPCPLLFFASKTYLENGMKNYVREHCVGDGLRARVISVALEARRQFPEISITDDLVRQVMRDEIARTPEMLREMAYRFMHIGNDGTNLERFGEALKAVLEDLQLKLDGEVREGELDKPQPSLGV